jgi:hypothetical protein
VRSSKRSAKQTPSGMVSNLKNGSIRVSSHAELRTDITYIDKAKREAVEDKRTADPQWYDITYIGTGP